MKFLKYVILFNLIIVLNINKVNAAVTIDNFSKTFIGNYHYVDSNGKFGDFEYFKRASDGSIAYCIEPGISLSNGTYQGYYDLTNNELASIVNIDEEKMSKISLIAHFGWGYNGHFGYEWIVATQSLIWKELGYNFQYTSQNSKNSPWKYVIDTPNEIQDKMNEILRLVLEYQKVPSFNTYHAKIPLKDSYNFIDYNNTVGNFIIKKCENCTSSINSNFLNIKPNNNQNGTVTIEKNSSGWSSKFVIYNHPEGQNMLVPGLVDTLEISVSYEVISGSINLYNYDEITKSCSPQQSGGNLSGSIFKLYKNDGTYIKDLTINDNCKANLSDLELGTYYVIQINAGVNYELKPNRIYFDLTLENPNKDLKIYNKMMLGQLKIYKYDSKTNSCKSSSEEATLTGATYGLYYQIHPLNWELIKRLNINELCESITEKNLLPGNYYLKELISPIGYKLDTKKHYFEINEKNVNEPITMTLKNDIYETNLTINKTYLTELGVSPETGAQFDIYYKNSNNKFSTIIIDESGSGESFIPYGSYIIKQAIGKKGYYLSEDIEFNVDENSNDNTYIHLMNEPYLAKLKVIKVDEDGNEVKIKGIKFKIYDVINKNYVCQSITYPYKKTICEFETDENGEFITPNNLYPSTYQLEEVDQLIDGYIWNKEKLEFTLDENSILDNGLIVKKFVNQKVKGNINIYFYEETNLGKVPIINGNIELYKDKEFIASSKTNEDGALKFSNLSLGEYIIKIGDKEYKVNLKYKDQYNSVIEETTEIVNRNVKDTSIIVQNIPNTGKNDLKNLISVFLIIIGTKFLFYEKFKKSN